MATLNGSVVKERLCMAKHRAEYVRQKLFWWQRRRRIHMMFHAWLSQWREFKYELADIYYIVKERYGKNVKIKGNLWARKVYLQWSSIKSKSQGKN